MLDHCWCILRLAEILGPAILHYIITRLISPSTRLERDVYQGGNPLPRHPKSLFGCFLTRFISPRPSPRGPGKGVSFTQMEVLASPVGNFPKFFTCQTRIRCGSYVLFRFFWVPSPPLQKLSPEVDPTPVSWPWQDFLEDSTPKRPIFSFARSLPVLPLPFLSIW